MGDVIQLPVIRIERGPDDRDNPGNGARAALMEIAPGNTPDEIDRFLARLWMQGFKVVPVEEAVS